MNLDTDLDEATVKECLQLAAKREASDCINKIRVLHPEIIIDDWLIQYARKRAYEMDCEKYQIACDET